eukprot:2971981-Pyramimonas_sp.AAC.2
MCIRDRHPTSHIPHPAHVCAEISVCGRATFGPQTRAAGWQERSRSIRGSVSRLEMKGSYTRHEDGEDDEDEASKRT